MNSLRALVIALGHGTSVPCTARQIGDLSPVTQGWVDCRTDAVHCSALLFSQLAQALSILQDK